MHVKSIPYIHFAHNIQTFWVWDDGPETAHDLQHIPLCMSFYTKTQSPEKQWANLCPR